MTPRTLTWHRCRRLLALQYQARPLEIPDRGVVSRPYYVRPSHAGQGHVQLQVTPHTQDRPYCLLLCPLECDQLYKTECYQKVALPSFLSPKLGHCCSLPSLLRLCLPFAGSSSDCPYNGQERRLVTIVQIESGNPLRPVRCPGMAGCAN